VRTQWERYYRDLRRSKIFLDTWLNETMTVSHTSASTALAD
jgi:hypothetical protein